MRIEPENAASIGRDERLLRESAAVPSDCHPRVRQRACRWKTGAIVERYAHLAPEALQGAANRLDAFGGYAAATPQRQTA